MIDQARLAESVGQLDPGTRALLDLSLRRAIPDEQVAKVLGVDPTSIPPRRARGIAQLADMMEIPGPAELAALLIALPELPEHAWGVPQPVPFPAMVSRARRARALRRVAVAASPLVALAAVIAAVLVSSGSEQPTGTSLTSSTGAGARAGGSQAAITAPEPRHGLPAGVQLTLSRPSAGAHRVHHAALHKPRHHGPAESEHAILARHPSVVERSEQVSFHPAPVHHAPVKHRHAPAKPKHVPTPNRQPSVAPAPQTTRPVQLSAPRTQAAPERASVESEGHGHRRGHGAGKAVRHGPPHSVPVGNGGPGNNWSPPGLFKKKNG